MSDDTQGEGDSVRRTFMARVLSGDVLELDEVEDEVGLWHDASTDLPLAEWLGFTRDEYALFVERADSLPMIVQARAYGIDLHQFLLSANQGVALAARGANGDAKELIEWLRTTGRL